MLNMGRLLPVFCLFIYVIAVTLGAFTGGVWAMLGIGGAVLLFLGVWVADKKMPLPHKKFAFFVLTALWVLGAELSLSSNVGLSIKAWLHLASIFLPLLLLMSPRVQAIAFSRSCLPAVAMAMSIGAIALGLELYTGVPFLYARKGSKAALSEYNRGMAHMTLLAFPLVAGLWACGSKNMAVVLVLILLFPAGLTVSHTARLALIVGMVCTAVAFYRPVLTQCGLAAAAFVFAGWPFYAQRLFSTYHELVAQLPDSWLHRIEIWDFLSYRIAERPIWGWGLGTTHTLDYTQPHGELYRFAVQAAPHAHNFIVQLWVETGLPGLALGLAFLMLVLRRAGTLHPSLRPFALGGIAAAVTVCLFGFNFWTDALWAAMALSAFVFGMLQQNCERKDHLIDA